MTGCLHDARVGRASVYTLAWVATDDDRRDEQPAATWRFDTSVIESCGMLAQCWGSRIGSIVSAPVKRSPRLSFTLFLRHTAFPVNHPTLTLPMMPRHVPPLRAWHPQLVCKDKRAQQIHGQELGACLSPEGAQTAEGSFPQPHSLQWDVCLHCGPQSRYGGSKLNQLIIAILVAWPLRKSWKRSNQIRQEVRQMNRQSTNF